MAKAYDRDLRVRVVAAIEAGASTAAAAERFGIGKATAGAWARLKRTSGDIAPGKQGKPSRSKLDPHTDFIFGLLDETIDISLAEIAARLQAERDVRVVPATIWYFFARRDWTFKKRMARPVCKGVLERRVRGDCRKFRVSAGMMREGVSHAQTQSPLDPGRDFGPVVGRRGRQDRL